MEEIRNKVAESGLITLSLEDFYPKGPRLNLDLAPWLFEGLMLREKDFRAYLKDHDWKQYQDAYVAVYCSADAIIPQWAYMLIAVYLQEYAKKVVFGNQEHLESLIMEEALAKLDVEPYRDQRIIVKGCGDINMPAHAYLKMGLLLKPVVKSLLFGEACSTVPIYKNKPSKAWKPTLIFYR